MDISLKKLTNYHETEGDATLCRALKIGLDHSQLVTKEKDIFRKRINGNGERHRANPITITDLPTWYGTPKETLREFSEQYNATVRIYAGDSMELSAEYECGELVDPANKRTPDESKCRASEEREPYVYLHEPSPGRFNVIFLPHRFKQTSGNRTYGKHCHHCNTSYQRNHGWIRCEVCHLRYHEGEKHVHHHRKCNTCNVTVDVRNHTCGFATPAKKSTDIKVVSFDVGKEEREGGAVVATGVEVIDGDSHHVFTMGDFLAYVNTYLESKGSLVTFVCGCEHDLNLVYAEALRCGVHLKPNNGNRISKLESRGCTLICVKSIIDVKLENYAKTFQISEDVTDPLRVRHLGQLAYAKCFLDLCQTHPFAFASKAALAFHVYCRDHMPTDSIPFIERKDFDVPCGGGLNPVGHAKYVCAEGEQIKEVDFNSLYPSLMLSKPYPKGQPLPLRVGSDLVAKITEACLRARPHEDRVQELTFAVIAARNAGKDTAPLKAELAAERARVDELYKPLPFGVLNVEMDAPPKQSLRHALLKVNGKYQFVRGELSVCTPELYRAIGLGYPLLKVIRGRIFKETRTDLFESYVRTFWKMKCQAGGFPDGSTEAQKDTFINDCLDATGIQLEKDDVEVNPGMRQVAKMCLNILWGKFIQRSSDSETRILGVAALGKCLENKCYTDVSWSVVGKNKLLVTCKKKDADKMYREKVNPYIAAFTTCYGRLALYNVMNWLEDDQFVYGNTDSCFYVVREGGKVIPPGRFLGELKDELAANEYITKMECSTNSYQIELNTGKISTSLGGVRVPRGAAIGDQVEETTTRCTKLGEVRRETKKRTLKLPQQPGLVRGDQVFPWGYF